VKATSSPAAVGAAFPKPGVPEGTVVLATRHGKERVIAPAFESLFDCRVVVPPDLDTDRFGSFTRERPRRGTPRDAARAKARAALEEVPEARWAIASEGSVGPHPVLPGIAHDRELVLLVARDTGLEVAGFHETTATNYDHRVVITVGAGLAFAERLGFPDHGIVVMGCAGLQPRPEDGVHKDLADWPTLERALGTQIRERGAAWIEADLRAHRNPTRMQAIASATADLLRRFASRCPACLAPGYAVVEYLPGRPCSDCGAPTRLPSAEISGCGQCGHRETRLLGGFGLANPAACRACNP
jgi:hypothetical protein